MLSTRCYPLSLPIVLSFCFVHVVFTFLDLFMCLSILSACIYVHLVCAGRGLKKAVSPLERSYEWLGATHMGARSQTLILCKNSKFS